MSIQQVVNYLNLWQPLLAALFSAADRYWPRFSRSQCQLDDGSHFSSRDAATSCHLHDARPPPRRRGVVRGRDAGK